jgi:hypothetical protein
VNFNLTHSCQRQMNLGSCPGSQEALARGVDAAEGLRGKQQMPGQYMNAARNRICLALLIVAFAASVGPALAQDKRPFAVIPAN